MSLLPALGWNDQRAIDRALELAESAAAFASPNPTVGCVLTRGGLLLGEGSHRYDHRDHAEIAAIHDTQGAGHSLLGATAFVTLEPCAHHGRTGPCADALVAAGIARCVVATVDPNPLVRGRGLEKFRAAGVAVDLLPPASPEAQRARRLNNAFAFAIQFNRPFVILKSAVSADGCIAPPPSLRRPGEPHWLTGPAARADVARLRHRSDALLTGIGTVLADDPQLADRSGLPRRRPLLRVVLDSHLRLPASSRLVQEAANDLLIFCDEALQRGDAAGTERLETLRRFPLEIVSIKHLGTPEGLSTVLQKFGDRGVRSVLLEAGSTLNGAMLKAGFVDKVVLYHASRELGAGSLSFAANGASPLALQQQLTAQSRTPFPHGSTEDIRVEGYLHDPWEGI